MGPARVARCCRLAQRYLPEKWKQLGVPEPRLPAAWDGPCGARRCCSLGLTCTGSSATQGPPELGLLLAGGARENLQLGRARQLRLDSVWAGR